MGNAARLRSQIFPDVPSARKGLIGGMVVVLVAVVAFVLVISGRGRRKPKNAEATN